VVRQEFAIMAADVQQRIRELATADKANVGDIFRHIDYRQGSTQRFRQFVAGLRPPVETGPSRATRSRGGHALRLRFFPDCPCVFVAVSSARKAGTLAAAGPQAVGDADAESAHPNDLRGNRALFARRWDRLLASQKDGPGLRLFRKLASGDGQRSPGSVLSAASAAMDVNVLDTVDGRRTDVTDARP
jgi:hypothetical protein